MKERPIIMDGASVRAILEGRKTQERRIVWPQPRPAPCRISNYGEMGWMPESNSGKIGVFNPHSYECPFGKTGDRLWVRETWGIGCRPDPYSGWVDGIEYKADMAYLDDIESLPLRVVDDQDLEKYESKGWMSPVTMPRWASQITLEITDIRVERLQDITPEDALREGFHGYGIESSTLDAFCEAWQSLNSKRGYPWKSNPWVWVIEFKVVE